MGFSLAARRGGAVAFAVALVGALPPAARAADNFTADITVGAQSVHLGFKTAEEVIDIVKTQNLGQQVTYTGTEQASVLVNFRGLDFILTYPAPGSTQLNFFVPKLNINLTFNGNGGTVSQARDDAQAQLRDYLKNGDLVGQIQKQLAKDSPIDPIAGNPNSLQSRMVMSDYNSSFSAYASNIVAPQTAGVTQSVPNLVGMGMTFGSFSQGGLTTRTVSAPLSYTIRSEANPGHQFTVRAPITVAETEGAKSYYGSLGFTYRVPITKYWALAPAASYGAAGSKDLGAVAQMASGSLTSSYEIPIGSHQVTIGNMVGYYKTLKIKLKDYEFDPEIANTVYRNGLMWSIPMNPFGLRTAMELSYVNTIFRGTPLFSNTYNEFGMSFGSRRGSEGLKAYLRAGVTYLYSPTAKGASVNAGVWF
jgi:hypothetical protein